MQRKKRHDIRLPEAYRKAEKWEHSGFLDDELRETMRTLVKETGEHVHYVMDPENADYLDFLDECKKQTKQLEAQLEKLFKTEGLPFTTKSNKKAWKRVNVLIRPPFLASWSEDAQRASRYTPHKDQIIFYVHVDEDGQWQQTRVGTQRLNYAWHDMMAQMMDRLYDALDDPSFKEKNWKRFGEKFVEGVADDFERRNIRPIQTLEELEENFDNARIYSMIPPLAAFHQFVDHFCKEESRTKEEIDECKQKLLTMVMRSGLFSEEVVHAKFGDVYKKYRVRKKKK